MINFILLGNHKKVVNDERITVSDCMGEVELSCIDLNISIYDFSITKIDL
jgi:hypothetical protein